MCLCISGAEGDTAMLTAKTSLNSAHSIVDSNEAVVVKAAELHINTRKLKIAHMDDAIDSPQRFSHGPATTQRKLVKITLDEQRHAGKNDTPIEWHGDAPALQPRLKSPAPNALYGSLRPARSLTLAELAATSDADFDCLDFSREIDDSDDEYVVRDEPTQGEIRADHTSPNSEDATIDVAAPKVFSTHGEDMLTQLRNKNIPDEAFFELDFSELYVK